MRTKLIFAFLGLTLLPPAARAADSMALANELGNLLASEGPCGLSYDQAAIEKFINSNVKDDDMRFPGTLSIMTKGAEVQIGNMSPSAKTAHCTQIKRIAKRYAFSK
ncbi:hypothetical protein H4S14_003381 [Agrobacterium vitis]|nr:hypothetical protein [Agrobacterium vitis]MBE1439616.1 hypothetical protein [Agrobacterium vitis]